ncbi:uncharacterized protein LOC105429011 [Pogonomyrmex barbatus]|uniref:Uncharacterized protein LOC105429011 n=1 Tax=Pogonomyrmex barbatus TaxID=144034 RepID=A0A6I9WG04_9HYME|nr:uncharacterized protein LOC105429011 [Pogonomyrmex barbatus]
MKGIYIFAIAFLAFSTEITATENQIQQSSLKERSYCLSTIPTVCPFPEKYASNLPHETNCTKFYKCFLGKGVLQDCPLMTKGDPYTRLHYNRQEMVCDWPWRAGCINCPDKDENGCWPEAKISHETDDCNLYYECINGEKHLRRCTPGTCFSRTCQACVRNRAGGNCEDNTCDGDKRKHECNCNMYYECYNNEWYPKYCGGGLHFDPRTKSCVAPNEANCVI